MPSETAKARSRGKGWCLAERMPVNHHCMGWGNGEGDWLLSNMACPWTKGTAVPQELSVQKRVFFRSFWLQGSASCSNEANVLILADNSNRNGYYTEHAYNAADA